MFVPQNTIDVFECEILMCKRANGEDININCTKENCSQKLK